MILSCLTAEMIITKMILTAALIEAFYCFIPLHCLIVWMLSECNAVFLLIVYFIYFIFIFFTQTLSACQSSCSIIHQHTFLLSYFKYVFIKTFRLFGNYLLWLLGLQYYTFPNIHLYNIHWNTRRALYFLQMLFFLLLFRYDFICSIFVIFCYC